MACPPRGAGAVFSPQSGITAPALRENMEAIRWKLGSKSETFKVKKGVLVVKIKVPEKESEMCLLRSCPSRAGAVFWNNAKD